MRLRDLAGHSVDAAAVNFCLTRDSETAWPADKGALRSELGAGAEGKWIRGVVGSANLKTEPTEQRGRLELDHARPNRINGLIQTEISVCAQKFASSPLALRGRRLAVEQPLPQVVKPGRRGADVEQRGRAGRAAPAEFCSLRVILREADERLSQGPAA